MGRSALSVRSFRSNKVPRPPTEGSLVEGLLDSLAERPDLQLTRREMLAFTGSAAVCAASATPAAASMLSSATCEAGSGYARISIGSRTLTVDAKAFGGAPTVEATGDADAFTVRLRGATYPGTDIPADFTLEVEGARTRPWVRITTALGGCAEVPLLAWLEGKVRAHARVSLNRRTTRLGPNYRFVLDGAAELTVRPDLGLEFDGAHIARIEGARTSAVSNHATVWMPERSSSTLLNRRVARRTLVQISRDDENWVMPSIATGEGHSVDLGFSAFDLATIECAETGAGRRLAVLAVDDASGTGLAWAHVVNGSPTKGSPIPLLLPRLALDCETEDFALEAEMARNATWLHQAGRSVLLARDERAPQLSAEGVAGVATKLDVTAQVLGLAVPLDDDDVAASPITFPEEMVRSMAGLPSLNPFGSQAAAPIALDAGSVTLTRRTDMLSLKFEFFNLALGTGTDGKPALFARGADAPSYLVAEFPPQAVLEEAFYQQAEWDEDEKFTDPDSVSSTTLMSRIAAIIIDRMRPPIRARIADPTRLAFVVPAAALTAGIPYTLEGLLSWTNWDSSVVPSADGEIEIPGVPIYVRRPKKGAHYSNEAPETLIEAPWGLILSPHSTHNRWHHRTSTFKSNDNTELWHTTLSGRTIYLNPPAGAGANAAAPISLYYPPRVRVVWARGYRDREPAPNIPFKNSLTTPDISDITGQMNRWALVDITTQYQHDPIDARRLTLTTLGAWLDLKGAWPIEDYLVGGEQIATAVEAWEHRATMGRDQFVRVVKAGRLFPWGHRASLITITERKFRESPAGYQTGYLIQRSFIVVREFEKTYDRDDTSRSRHNPFKKVTIKTRVTPDLKDPMTTRASYSTPSGGPYTAKSGFWPKILTTSGDVLFKYVAEDWDGNLVEFTSPLIWIALEYAIKTEGGHTKQELSDEVGICSNAMAGKDITLTGQKIAYARPLPAGTDRDRRTLETISVKLKAENVPSSILWGSYPVGEDTFHPQLHRARVRIEEAEGLMNVDSGVWIELWSSYLGAGYGGFNVEPRTFAKVSDNGAISSTPTPSVLKLDIPPDKAGGFATPNVSVGGISAYYGPFGGDPLYYGTGVAPPASAGESRLAAVPAGQVDPLTFFEGADPELFGGITLTDILRGVGIPLDKLPKFNDFTEDRADGKWAVYEYVWHTDTFGTESDIFIPKGNNGVGATLALRAYLEKSLSKLDAPPSSGVTGDLNDFTLSLFDIIEVEFTRFSFGVINGGEVAVDPVINDIRFAGALEFVNQLREMMNFTSKDGGFAIDIDGSGLSAIVTIALPDIAVGVFSLKNMAITAGFKLPFDGSPLKFPISFCTREKPFELAVSGFGGGGYFLVELQADPNNALASLELSFEFGLSCSVSLCGIASGGVEIKGGVLLRIAGEELSFKAYFRMGGYLDILGIISCSIVFNLSLEYQNKAAAGLSTSLLIGEASLTIEIEILFFSFSVELMVHKEFEGDDPRFGDWMDADDWADYCEAYGLAKLGA